MCHHVYSFSILCDVYFYYWMINQFFYFCEKSLSFSCIFKVILTHFSRMQHPCSIHAALRAVHTGCVCATSWNVKLGVSAWFMPYSMHYGSDTVSMSLYGMDVSISAKSTHVRSKQNY